MAGRDFLFVFVRDSTYRPPVEYLLPYVRFRYPSAEAHKVLSVEDAHKFMLKALGAHDTVNHVYVSGHASSAGYVWGRLRSSDQFRSIAHPDVLAFSRSDPGARRVAARGTKQTVVSVLGCNLGKHPEALTRWRDLFGGAAGTGVAPTLFQHYAAPRPRLRATWRRTVFHEQAIASASEIPNYVANALAQASKRGYRLRDTAAAALTQAAHRDLDGWLVRYYQLYVRGNELPAQHRGLSRAQAVRFMREVLEEYSGIPTTFLLPALDLPIFDRTGAVRRYMRPRGGVFPEDRAWSRSHHTVRTP